MSTIVIGVTSLSLKSKNLMTILRSNVFTVIKRKLPDNFHPPLSYTKVAVGILNLTMTKEF